MRTVLQPPAPPRPQASCRRVSAALHAWSFAAALCPLVALGLGCETPRTVVVPLWEGDVVAPRFGDVGVAGGVDVGAGEDGHIAGGGATDAATGSLDALADGGGAAGGDGVVGDGAASDGGVDADAAGVDVADADADGVGPDVAGDAIDSGDGDSGGVDASLDGGEDAGAAPPTMAKVWSGVIQPYGCATPACHGAKSGSPLFVDLFSTRAKLIGQPAQGPCAPALLVVPGDADASALQRKIEAALPLCGLPMPAKGGVDADAAALVRAWIVAGAPP